MNMLQGDDKPKFGNQKTFQNCITITVAFWDLPQSILLLREAIWTWNPSSRRGSTELCSSAEPAGSCSPWAEAEKQATQFYPNCYVSAKATL